MCHMWKTDIGCPAGPNCPFAATHNDKDFIAKGETEFYRNLLFFEAQKESCSYCGSTTHSGTCAFQEAAEKAERERAATAATVVAPPKEEEMPKPKGKPKGKAKASAGTGAMHKKQKLGS